MLHCAGKSPAMRKLICKECVILLPVLWVIGFAVGLYFLTIMDSGLQELFYSASVCSVSVVGMLISAFLPIFISAIAAYFSVPVLIYALCFFKAVCYSFVLCGIVTAFGYSGWLIRLMLLFTDSAITVLLFWLWHKLLSSDCCFTGQAFLICAAVAVAICAIDYFLVSPYLIMLMNHL